MPNISQVTIGGFRRLQSIDLNMKSFNVLIGANGVGKTSLLDAFSLLSASASGILKDALFHLGGISNIMTRGRSKEVYLIAQMEMPKPQPLKYDLHISPKGTGYSISKEILSDERDGYNDPFKHIFSINEDPHYYDPQKGLVRPSWGYDSIETFLSQVPKMFSEPEKFRYILSKTTYYHELNVGRQAPIKLPQQMRPATSPGADGKDIVPYLYYLRETDTERFDDIVDLLRIAFPSFEGLSFPPVAAGTMTMTWKDRNFTEPIGIHELSEGMLRFLWLVSLLQSPTPSTITMIDEPEVSLHPELLSLLADLMREASQRTQLIVATHSDRFIRFLKPDEVVVMDIGEDGGAVATWATELDIEKWLDEYSLDEVWQMGQMGGRS
ncbi:MAG: AAA family ATPase [Candidatus Magnetominusculus sp. LBB02]|nr:AAA family ATPase [Candidatus Magnetominusculus sp. LBB02]